MPFLFILIIGNKNITKFVIKLYNELLILILS